MLNNVIFTVTEKMRPNDADGMANSVDSNLISV